MNKSQHIQQQAQDLFCRMVKATCGFSCIREYKFHPTRKWRFDYCIPERKIAIEVEGGAWIQGRHNRAEGFIGDMEKYNTAASMGWRLLRCTPQQLHTTAFLNIVKATAEYSYTPELTLF